MTKTNTRQLTLCALFTALIAVGAFLRVPFPVVPFTLQTMFVMLAGLLLGARMGAVSALTYLLLGLVGLPIFTQGGGPAYVLQPTFGYIIGFVFGAYLSGYIAHRVPNPTALRLFGASMAGLAVVYLCGTVYFGIIKSLYLGTPMGLWTLLTYCVISVLPGDIISSLLGVLLAKRLLPVVQR